MDVPIETQRPYKICLVGDGGVGKTTYINRIINDVFDKNYEATVGMVQHRTLLYTTTGVPVNFLVLDTAGQEGKQGLKDFYYIGADGAIFFYDVTSRVSCANLPNWIYAFKKAAGQDKPIVVVGNKIDLSDRKVTKSLMADKLKRYFYYYCEVSAKTRFGFELPFTYLLRVFTGNEDIMFGPNLNDRPSGINYDVGKDEQSKINEDYIMAQDADIEE